MTKEEASYYARHTRLYLGIIVSVIVIVSGIWGGFKVSYVMGEEIAIQKQANIRSRELVYQVEEDLSKVKVDLQGEEIRSTSVDESMHKALSELATDMAVQTKVMVGIGEDVNKQVLATNKLATDMAIVKTKIENLERAE